MSWQLVQNPSVFVASMAVLNPPQKIIPATKPPPKRVRSEKRALGRRNALHSPRTNPAWGEPWELLLDVSFGVSTMAGPLPHAAWINRNMGLAIIDLDQKDVSERIYRNMSS